MLAKENANQNERILHAQTVREEGENIVAVNININHDITGYVGKNNTHITCSFVKDNNKNLINVAIIARNKYGIFIISKPVAVFPPEKTAILPPSGDYLSGRVTLTNITKVSTTATLRFNNLKCEDEKDYICTFNYIDDFGVVITDESEPTRILVKAYPSMPDSISCVATASIRIQKQDNSSTNFPNNRNNFALSPNRNSRSSLLTDTGNLIPLLTTDKSVPSFREGDTVKFTCTGNIGKPPGRFVWQIIPQQGEPIVYSNETTVVVDQIPDICSYRGTSNLTVQITADHFKAKVRCFEESTAEVEGMFVETEPLDVNYHVRHINITKQPNKAQYEEKTPTINLTCTGDGNPKPTYKWFRQENTRSILSSTNLYIIEDGVQNNSGVYICEVYNTIDDIEYSANFSVEIDIVDELWSSKESDSLEISEEYAALVIPVICVVVMSMILFGVRKHNCKSDKGKISRLQEASVIYSEVNEHTMLKYRLKIHQATSSNSEHADVEHDLMEDANEVSGDPRFKYNMITGKLEVILKYLKSYNIPSKQGPLDIACIIVDILAVNITINQNITGVVGKNDTHLTCSFIKDINQNFINVAIIVINKDGISPQKEPVAIFQPDKVASLPPSGDYLSGRVTLTNITKASTKATLRFDYLECEDEKDYMCTFTYVNEFGVVIIDESEPTRILVKAFPSMPDSISHVVIASMGIKKQENSSENLLNNQNNFSLSTNRNSRLSFSTLLTDAVTLIPLRTTNKSVSSFRGGDTVQFICTGNIGKPPGRFVWQIVPQQREPIVYSNETTVVVDQIPDICSFRGTSNLTVDITADHFKAKVRCFEESQADMLGMFVETKPLNVFYPVRHINITKQPNKAQYDQKTPTINVTCKGDGNPKPTYRWFRQENTRSILSSTNLYIIEDVVQNNSGVYICEAYNTIDDIEYNANYSVKIDIVDELWSSTESESLKISAAVGLNVEVSLRTTTNYYNHELTTEESRPVCSVIPQRMDFYY
ncbi:unnamed protein product [Mytilus coruscus]|uniref:Ig-like domain-containing protein n=1 Tax=Mytilus coruscus TaxID=42192 RepID=A0A6J8EXG3_MYTCO|nr:unnamed protein product [Mytilus coruscus]